MEKTRVKKGIQIDEELYRKFDSRVSGEGRNLYEVWEELVEGYLGITGGPAVARVPRKYQPIMEMTAVILSSGDVSAIRALSANVEHFHDRLRPVESKGRQSQP